ncbi:matrixin [Myxococcaceae bacterium GXIMD 01537]
MLATLVSALVLGQSSAPYVRSRVDPKNEVPHCLYWTRDRVVWQQSSAGNPQRSDDSEFVAVRRAFQSWQDLFAQCGNLTLEEGPRVDDRAVGYAQKGENRNLVLFRTRRCLDFVPSEDACWKANTCGNVHDCWQYSDEALAITLTTHDERSGIIYDSDIELNAAAYSFTTADPGQCDPRGTGPCISTDTQNTVTHEVGHLIGLDHTEAWNSTMNRSAPTGELTKRTIDSGSASFVCAVYPKGGESQSCVHRPVNTELGAAAGCSLAGEGAWLPAAAAWLWLARRRSAGGRA